MSAKPVTVPTWATNTNYSTGDYAGGPTKVAPSAGVRQDGHMPDTPPLAEHENYDRNLIGAWLQYLSDGKLSGDHAVVDGAMLTLSNGGEFGYCTSGGVYEKPTRTIYIPLFTAQRLGVNHLLATVDDSPDIYGSTITPTSAGDGWVWHPWLPRGAELLRVRVGVTQGATASTDMKLTVGYHQPDTTTPSTPLVATLGTDTAADSGDDILVVDISGGPYVRQATTNVWIRLNASNGAGPDTVWWVEIQFKDPGPRNY